jgi:hypothetical protein
MLPFDFGSLVHLETLDMSFNQLNSMPSTVSKLKKLRVLNLQSNNFTTLNDELAMLDSCEFLDMSQNLLVCIPPPVVHMINLKTLNLSRNTIGHMAVNARQMTNKDLWKPIINEADGKNMFLNVLTKEKLEIIEAYDGKGIERMKALHSFQPAKGKNYPKRKFWLNVCGVNEWDACEDELANVYFKNNVSGETQWDMPQEVNLLGLSRSLQSLDINENLIKTFAPSIVAITTLKKLSVFENKVKELPARIGELINLETLDLHNNDIRLLPRTFADLTSLVKLRLNGNQLVRLPDLLGRLPKLVHLDVTANRLNALPFSLGYCETLTDLLCQENPLTDPPIEETAKGLDAFKWYMRQRYVLCCAVLCCAVPPKALLCDCLPPMQIHS